MQVTMHENPTLTLNQKAPKKPMKTHTYTQTIKHTKHYKEPHY
jgi:hypothetical protein